MLVFSKYCLHINAIHISKKPLGLFLLLCPVLCIISCSRTQPKICYKDGRQYCVTSDRLHVITWDACYRRGINCMEGQCWEYAVEEFQQAIDMRYKDQRHARAYGMHFRDEYFPHRELGISYFRLGKIQESLQELELSLSQTPSARAKYYLNQARRSFLLETGMDSLPPVIRPDLSERDYLTNQTPFQMKGIVSDDHFVGSLYINQKPLFIELAQPIIPFNEPVDLRAGWNTIQIMAQDLVDRQTRQNMKIYLDQQSPTVIINPVHSHQVKMPHKVTVTAVVYDVSGIISFTLNKQEVPRTGLEHLCLIEQTLTLPSGAENISFSAQDRAGNITQGRIPLDNLAKHSVDRRLACRNPENMQLNLCSLATETREETDITFDITHPPQENFTTFYDEIFLEGMIKAHHGIQKIELNGRLLFSLSEIKDIVEKKVEDLVQVLLKQGKDTERYLQLLYQVVQSCNFYYLNQKLALENEMTDFTLLVEDGQGNQKSKHCCIQKIPKEEVVKSEQRMVLALLPLDTANNEGEEEHSLQKYINTRLVESFISQGRFHLVEREKLPWILIEKTIQEKGKIYRNDVAQKIGKMAAAEGIICGYILHRDDGTEILARFIEVETGLIRLFHDVFNSQENKESMNTVISGLAMKFRDSFPICTGTIIAKKKRNIQVDFGSEKGIFPGMIYNIFQNEEELIGKAHIFEVKEGFSEAGISEREKIEHIHVGYQVRTR